MTCIRGRTPIFLLLLLLLQPPIAAAAKTDFPRLGGTKFGAPHAYNNPSAQAQLAKLDYLLIDFFPRWGSVAEMRDTVKAIKAKNPNIVILDYVIQETIHNTFPGTQPFRDKLDAENWWLYKNGTGGTKVGPNVEVSTTNFTNSAPKDANGDRWNTWLAKYVYNTVWSKIPELDGTFTDNVFWKPRVNGDWDRNGTTDIHGYPPADPKVYPEFRTGMMAHLNQLRALMPGKLVTGNIGDWGRPEAKVPEYEGQLDGGLLELYIGQTWSIEGLDINGNLNGGSWPRMMAAYHKVMGLVRDPKLVVFGSMGRPADYKTFRYAFASALMDDAYFDFSDGTDNIYTTKVVWFDEFDLAGASNTGWLGAAVDPPQTASWQNGVYRRRFANGMALVNPRGNGNQTLEIEPGYRRIDGPQAPAINSGAIVDNLMIADRDGIVLLKLPALAAPVLRYEEE